jgi:hypothetical protein
MTGKGGPWIRVFSEMDGSDLILGLKPQFVFWVFLLFLWGPPHALFLCWDYGAG